MTSQDLRVCTLVTDSEGNSGSQGPGRAFPVVRVELQVDGSVTREGAVSLVRRDRKGGQQTQVL